MTYLVYTCWEYMGSHGGIIAGSLLHNEYPETESHAKEIVKRLEENHNAFKIQMPFLFPNDEKTRFIYINKIVE